MFINHSQDSLDIKLDNSIKNVGLKISGGADSAIVGYILSKYVAEERPDITIIPITVDQEGKAFQITFAKRIVEFYKQEFGNIFGKHYTSFSPLPESENYIKTQDTLIKSLYEQKIIDFHFAGITLNPPTGSIPDHIYKMGWIDPPDRKRTENKNPIYHTNRCTPLVNIDKQGVAELYRTFGVINTLFPLTRSCESYTNDFSFHCDSCWFCAERKWGFGKL